VNLNGQAPIQAYARVIEKREIRINSIDFSTRVVIKTLEELLDYRKPGSQFALAKAACVGRQALGRGRRRFPAHGVQVAGGCGRGQANAGEKAAERQSAFLRLLHQPRRPRGNGLLENNPSSRS